MSTLKYRTKFDNIDVVEVVSETNKMVTIDFNGRKRKASKRSSYQNYFNSHSEAVNFLIKTAEQRVSTALSRLEYQQEKLDNLKRKYK